MQKRSVMKQPFTRNVAALSAAIFVSVALTAAPVQARDFFSSFMTAFTGSNSHEPQRYRSRLKAIQPRSHRPAPFRALRPIACAPATAAIFQLPDRAANRGPRPATAFALPAKRRWYTAAASTMLAPIRANPIRLCRTHSVTAMKSCPVARATGNPMAASPRSTSATIRRCVVVIRSRTPWAS